MVAATVALYVINLAEKPADREHQYGHSKAEYFSSLLEGTFIFIAALAIIYTAIPRIIHPKMIEKVYLGLVFSGLATIINYIVSKILIKTGKKHHSITLEADGHHLMTDVLTSIGVIVGVIIVSLTNINILDPLIAIAVAINIFVTGFQLIIRSINGLLDKAVSPEDLYLLKEVLKKYEMQGIEFHGLRTRQSAQRRFVTVHVLTPGNWSIKKGHDLLEKIEKDIRSKLPKTTVTTHLEPIGDPVSKEDISIERK